MTLPAQYTTSPVPSVDRLNAMGFNWGSTSSSAPKPGEYGYTPPGSTPMLGSAGSGISVLTPEQSLALTQTIQQQPQGAAISNLGINTGMYGAAGAGQSTAPATAGTSQGGTPLNATNLGIWEQFRQDNVNNFNSTLASRPDLQQAGLQPLTFQAGSYGGVTPTMPGGPIGSSSFNAGGSAPAGGGQSAAPHASGMSNLGMGNPYLPGQATAIQNQQQQFLDANLNNQRSNAVAVGGYGGDRDYLMRGQAIGQASQGLTDSLANLYGNSYNQDANRYLQQYGMDQGYNTAQRGLDQSQFGLGLQAWNMGNNGAWGPLNNATGVTAPFAGNGTTTTNSQSGGGWQGGIGGGLTGLSFARQMGWL